MYVGVWVCGYMGFWMVAQNPEVRAAAKYQPGYDGLRESGKNLPPGMAECANGPPSDRATRRSRVGTAEAGARGVFRLVLAHMLQHANPGFKTRFECKGRCKSTADAELHHPHTSTPTHAFCLPPAADCRVGRQLSSELTFAFRL